MRCFEKLPFAGSRLSAEALLERKADDSLSTRFRDRGTLRIARAVGRHVVDAILDVHTTDKRLYAQPDRRQSEWRHEWVPPYSQSKTNSKGKFAHEVTVHARPEEPGQWPAEYTLELPAETKPLPARWKKKLAGLKLSADDRKYLRVHKPVRLSDETAAKIARAFHKRVAKY
ncbi:MAG: hypothetical protein AB1626_00940 [Candidatus Micrarchaeota archaeon]